MGSTLDYTNFEPCKPSRVFSGRWQCISKVVRADVLLQRTLPLYLSPQKKGKESVYLGDEVPDVAGVHGRPPGGSPLPPPKPSRLTLVSAIETEISESEVEDRIDFR